MYSINFRLTYYNYFSNIQGPFDIMVPISDLFVCSLLLTPTSSILSCSLNEDFWYVLRLMSLSLQNYKFSSKLRFILHNFIQFIEYLIYIYIYYVNIKLLISSYFNLLYSKSLIRVVIIYRVWYFIMLILHVN